MLQTLIDVTYSPAFNAGLMAGAGVLYTYAGQQKHRREREMARAAQECRAAEIERGKPRSLNASAVTSGPLPLVLPDANGHLGGSCSYRPAYHLCIGCGNTAHEALMEWTTDHRWLCRNCRTMVCPHGRNPDHYCLRCRRDYLAAGTPRMSPMMRVDWNRHRDPLA